jgi:hypothetical protein
MKTFRIQIRAYGYYTTFNVTCDDSEEALNDAIVDKLGQNDVVWEVTGFYNKSKTWITYEEVNDANIRSIPLQTEEGTRTGMGAAL